LKDSINFMPFSWAARGLCDRKLKHRIQTRSPMTFSGA
jgi:hypothetical protein